MATFTAWIENSNGESFPIETNGTTVREVATDLIAHLLEENHVPPFSEWDEDQLSATKTDWSATITEIATGEKFAAYLTAETSIAHDVIAKAKEDLQYVLESQESRYEGYDFSYFEEDFTEAIEEFTWIPDPDDTTWDVASKLSEYLEDLAGSKEFYASLPISATYEALNFYRENWVGCDEFYRVHYGAFGALGEEDLSQMCCNAAYGLAEWGLKEVLSLLSEIVSNYTDSDFDA